MAAPAAPAAVGAPSGRGSRVSTVIVTGPLAAGKSRLVGALLEALAQHEGARVAVICHKFANEFEIETERCWPAARAAFCGEVYDFGTGCVCCSPKGDFVRLLTQLAAEQAGRQLTHLIVETTGLAEPAVFARLFAPAAAPAPAAPAGPAGAAEDFPSAASAASAAAAAAAAGAARAAAAPALFELRGVLAVLDPAAAAAQLAEAPPKGLANKARTQLAAAGLLVLNGRAADGAADGAGAGSGAQGGAQNDAEFAATVERLRAAAALTWEDDGGNSSGSVAAAAALAAAPPPSGRDAGAASAVLPPRVLPSLAAVTLADAFFLPRAAADGAADAPAGTRPDPPGFRDAGAGAGGAGGADEPPPLLSFALQAHDRRVDSHCLVAEGPLDPGRVATWLESLQAMAEGEGGGQLLRIKADICLRTGPVVPLGAGGAVREGAGSGAPWLVVDGRAGAPFRRWPAAANPAAAAGPADNLAAEGASGAAPGAGGRCGDATCEAIHAGGGGGGGAVRAGRGAPDASPAPPGDAPAPAATSKVFLVGRGLAAGSLQAGLRAAACPEGYAYAGDTAIDFGLPSSAGPGRAGRAPAGGRARGGAGSSAGAAALAPATKAIEVDLRSAGGDEILLVHVAGRFYATSAACPHAGGRLAQGDIEDWGAEPAGAAGSGPAPAGAPPPLRTLACPLHKFTFSLDSGACLTARCAPMPLYDVALGADGAIYVALRARPAWADAAAGVPAGTPLPPDELL